MFRSKRIVHHPATLLGCGCGFFCPHGTVPSLLGPVKEIKAILLFSCGIKTACTVTLLQLHLDLFPLFSYPTPFYISRRGRLYKRSIQARGGVPLSSLIHTYTRFWPPQLCWQDLVFHKTRFLTNGLLVFPNSRFICRMPPKAVVHANFTSLRPKLTGGQRILCW